MVYETTNDLQSCLIVARSILVCAIRETYASITKNETLQILSYLVILTRTEAGANQGFFQ